MFESLDRRQFIRTSSALLALPWLETFAAGAPRPPARMVTVCTAFGLYGPAFFPEQAGADYEPSEYTSILNDLRADMTVFSGISHPDIGGDHASESCFLTAAKHPRRPGFRNTVSMDYLAAKHVGNDTRFPMMTLSTDAYGKLTHTNSGAGVAVEHSPSRLYAKMFLSGNPKQVDRRSNASAKVRASSLAWAAGSIRWRDD